MNTETQTPVQPELLWVDEKNLKEEKINVVRATTALNKFMLECETILKGELSPEYKNELKERKMAALMEEVRKKFKFPDASEQFNLESLGINLDAAKKLSLNSWPYQYELDDMGLFVADENQSVYEYYYHYADSERKQRALELANSLVEIINEGHEIKVLHGDHVQNICIAFNQIIKVIGDPRSSNAKAEVNPYAITQVERRKV